MLLIWGGEGGVRLSIQIFAPKCDMHVFKGHTVQVNMVYGTDSLIFKRAYKGSLHERFHTILLCLAEVKEGSPSPLR